MKKILIIGKRGFIGNSLTKYLKKSYIVSHQKFKDLKYFKSKINDFDYVINTSINKKYLNNKYNSKFDNDFKIANLITKNKSTYIFLSSRKVYKPKANIKEDSKLLPKSNYAKNKLISEKKLTKKLNKNLIILRISNVIGNKNKIKKIHNTFIDIFFQNIKKGFVLDNNKDFKDFISIEKFCEIIKNIIKKNLRGVFNVSIGTKIFLNDVIKWLNKYNKNRFKVKKSFIKNDCFYLNNKKLMKQIKISNSVIDLKKYCMKISRKKFN